MKKLLFLLVFIVGFSSLNQIFAAGMPPPPPGGGSTPPCWPPQTCTPIDGGILFLILAGAVYGCKKVYDLRKKSQHIV